MLALACMACGACAGNGDGLDQNGNPVGSSSSSSTPLTATFESIQDNVFTPICTRCHIGASAPEGLQLDAAHSYGLLVGVPSVEEPDLLRVDPGSPANSYIIHKLNGGPDIMGGQMPLGGPYLPQSTIDVIAQWITDGAQPPAASMAEATPAASFEVVATTPADGSRADFPVREIVVAFTHEVDASLVNSSTVTLERLTGANPLSASGTPLHIATALAPGNAATVILQPQGPLAPGDYRVTLRGSGGGALADLRAVTLGEDYTFVFAVRAAP